MEHYPFVHSLSTQSQNLPYSKVIGSHAAAILNKSKNRRVQRKKSRNGGNSLTTNYCEGVFPIEGKADQRILNKGMNFCPQPKHVNTTKIVAGIKRMRRSALWKDVHAFNDEESEYPIKEELSCYTENTIYSLTCIRVLEH